MGYPNYITAGHTRVLTDIVDERARQDAKWGPQHHPDGTSDDLGGVAEYFQELVDRLAVEGSTTWAGILVEEVAEALAETDQARLRTELVQVAAVCVNWIEDLDSRRVSGSVESISADAGGYSKPTEGTEEITTMTDETPVEYVDYGEAAAVREIRREMDIEAGDDSEIDALVAEDDARVYRTFDEDDLSTRRERIGACTRCGSLTHGAGDCETDL